MIQFLQNQPILTLFLIITIGYLIGQIKWKGFSLESSAILFVALIAGHLGLNLPSILKILGLLFFIYAIGLQAGPTFLTFFKRDGFVLNLVAFSLVSIGAIVTIVVVLLFHIHPEIAIGLFAGALTSTPGLAAAQEATNSGLTSIGYGVAYPFGVIGVIFFVKILPVLLKTSYKKLELNESEKKRMDTAQLTYQHNRVLNPAIVGKTLRDLHFRSSTGCIISRLMRDDQVMVPRADTILQKNDIVRVVGRAEDLPKATNLLGSLSEKSIPQSMLDVKRFVVTNKKIVGKKIRDISLGSYYNANITRIRRSGMEFPALPDQKLEWGDRLTIVGEKDIMPELKDLFGDDVKLLEEGNIYSIILGMVIGILLGMIPVSIGNIISLKMGITGGILLSGLILSNIGKTGPIIWRAPGPIITFIRELGLVLFLAVVGVQAGSRMMEVLHHQGLILLFAGALITVIPMLIIFLVNKSLLKIDLLRFSGLITGGMTSTPGLAAVTSSTNSSAPMITYAAVYPISMISMMIWAKFLALLL